MYLTELSCTRAKNRAHHVCRSFLTSLGKKRKTDTHIYVETRTHGCLRNRQTAIHRGAVGRGAHRRALRSSTMCCLLMGSAWAFLALQAAVFAERMERQTGGVWSRRGGRCVGVCVVLYVGSLSVSLSCIVKSFVYTGLLSVDFGLLTEQTRILQEGGGDHDWRRQSHQILWLQARYILDTTRTPGTGEGRSLLSFLRCQWRNFHPP